MNSEKLQEVPMKNILRACAALCLLCMFFCRGDSVSAESTVQQPVQLKTEEVDASTVQIQWQDADPDEEGIFVIYRKETGQEFQSVGFCATKKILRSI